MATEKRARLKRRARECWVWWHKGDEACAGMYAAQTASTPPGEVPFETPKCCGLHLRPGKDGNWSLMREVPRPRKVRR